MVRPEERKEEAKKIMQLMFEGKTSECSIPVITKTGEQIMVETKVKHGFWDGNPILFAVSKDISQIKLSEEKFSKAFHSNIALMAIATVEEIELIEVNSTFLKVLGYSREEVIGKTIRELEFFSNAKQGNLLRTKLDLREPVKEFEIEINTKHGEKRIGIFSADFIFIGNNQRVLASMVDITERKHIENKLVKAQLEAENANRAKSEFLSRMSHELRTPMNSILGFAQLLNMGSKDEKQKKGINHILKSGKHLLDLINEVLEISRIESGKLSLSLEPVRINNLFVEITEILQNYAREMNVTLVISKFNPDVYVKADKQKLKQVLINLVNNAVKYNRSGGIVNLKVEHSSKPGSVPKKVKILINDTGYGIKEEDILKLFNPFERIGAEKTNIEGSGLGLAVSKKLTEAMGGEIGIDSIEGAGSTFWIVFQEAQVQEKVKTDRKQTEVVSYRENQMYGLILYVEDNESNIELIVEVLGDQRPGIDLHIDKLGTDAISLAKELKPNLILLDLNLPTIQGDEILLQIMSDEDIKHIPVVIISADAMPKQIDKLLKLGARHYLTKPLDLNFFIDIVDAYIF